MSPMTRGRQGAERSDCDNACGFWNGAWDPACEGGVFQSICFMRHGSPLHHVYILAPRPKPVFTVRVDLVYVVHGLGPLTCH